MAAQAATQASLTSSEMAVYERSEKTPTVYILASKPNGTLYIGVTSSLYDRMRDHREGTFEGFTKTYNVKTLVYHEAHETMDDAIKRESQMKKWKRLWKIRLIEEVNPTWSDLFDEEDGVRDCGKGGRAPSELNEMSPPSGLLGWPPSRP
jgi:putative endonuclease